MPFKHLCLFDEAERLLGGIDIVLIAHGTLPNQVKCEASVEETLNEINTNAISTISLLTIATNRFEAQGKGILATISSVSGDRGRQSNYVYGASKGMISLFQQGLRNRLHTKGVTVITIKPGFVDTPMTANFDKKGFLWAKPELVAGGIVSAVTHRKEVVYLPGIWRWIMIVVRIIPELIFKRLSL